MVPVFWSIWLSISGHGAGVELGAGLARQRLDRDRPALQRIVQLRELLLGQAEQHRDRLELRHDHDAGGVARVHVVARVDQADAGAPADGRADAGVVELGACVVDRRVVAFYLRAQLREQRLLRVHGLLARQVLRGEQLVALHVAVRILELGAVLVARRDRHAEGRRERPRIDLRQQLALLDLLALLERDLLDLAVDARVHGHGIEGLHRAEALEVQRHVGALDGGHVDGDRGRRLGRGLAHQQRHQPVPGDQYREQRKQQYETE